MARISSNNCRVGNLRGVKRELGRLYRSAKAREIEPLDAARLASILAIIARLVESHDIERRLEQLEHRTGAADWPRAA